MPGQVTFEDAAFWKNRGCMSESKAADLAAQRVEAIVAAAQEAAEQIKQEARDQVAAEISDARKRAAEIEQRARDEAIEFDADTRREAERVIADARRRAAQIREQAKRSVAGRVERADAASAEMVGHAEALTQGLLQLGELLTEQGERILRDVQTARRGMGAQLKAAVRGKAMAEAASQDGEQPPTSGGTEEPDAHIPLRRHAGPSSRAAGGEPAGSDHTPPSWVEQS
jgi:hypothetical protein